MICVPASEKEINKIKDELENNRKLLLSSICHIDFGCFKINNKKNQKK